MYKNRYEIVNENQIKSGNPSQYLCLKINISFELSCIVFLHLMPLVLSVLLAHAAHERPRLAAVFQAHELDGVHLVLRAEHLLMGLVCQGHAPVLGQRPGGVCVLGALGTQVRGTHRAVHGSSVSLILITADYALME